MPASLALPFGTFERVMEEPANAAAAEQLQLLEASLAANAGQAVPAELAAIRELVSTQLVRACGGWRRTGAWHVVLAGVTRRTARVAGCRRCDWRALLP